MKNISLNIRMSSEEKDAWEIKASEAGVSLSQWIRSCCRKQARREEVPIDENKESDTGGLKTTVAFEPCCVRAMSMGFAYCSLCKRNLP